MFRRVYCNKYRLYSLLFCVLVQKGQYCGLCYVWGHIISVTVYRQGVRNRLFGTERYSLRSKLCYGKVQSALQTVIQNKYSLHYKLSYGKVHCVLETVLQNRYSLHFKLCYRTGTVCITSSSAFWPHVVQGRSATCSDS